MRFEWDEKKNASNIKKHGISFEEAATIFNGAVLTARDNRKDYGEIREISVGRISRQYIVAVVHTDRLGTTRIISARLASKAERKSYDDYYPKNA